MRSILQSSRLNLRPVKIADAREIAKLAGHPAIARMTGHIPQPYLYLAAEAWIMISSQHSAAGCLHLYGISHAKNDTIIGTIVIFPYADKGWEIGYWLGQAYWHQGLMREAASAVLAEADVHLDAEILHATVYKDNPRSMNLLLALGFQRMDKTTSAFCLARGQSVPLITFTRTRHIHHRFENTAQDKAMAEKNDKRCEAL